MSMQYHNFARIIAWAWKVQMKDSNIMCRLCKLPPITTMLQKVENISKISQNQEEESQAAPVGKTFTVDFSHTVKS